VNYRKTPAGVRLYLSKDGGNNWDIESPLQMWDTEQGRCLGQNANDIPATDCRDNDGNRGVWDDLQNFTFGTPDLAELPDQTVLMSYYATIEDTIHVRVCRFRIV